MDLNKSFLTISEQIDHLKNKGITIDSKTKVSKILEKNSYYNIVNGYNKPFLFQHNPKRYKRNLNFMEIYALYEFDNKLRNIIFPYLIEIENVLKTEIIYAFLNSRDNGGELLYKNDDYLKINNYDNSNIKKSLQVIVELENTIAKNLDQHSCLMHYLTNYSFVPLWVVSTVITFGCLSRFFEAMKIQNRQVVSKKYNLPENHLRTILKVLTLARNCCAHRNRLFCLSHTYCLPTFNSSYHPKEYYFVNRGYGNRNMFSIIICMSTLLSEKRMKSLVNALDNELNILEKKIKVISISDILNCLGFPNDWKNII